MKWYEKQQGTHSDVIISSRIRLARNLKDFVFPNHLSESEAEKTIEIIHNIFSEGQSDDFYFWDMDKVSSIDKVAMMERHLLSPLFVNMPIPNALIHNSDESLSLMINEEDHLRIQAMANGANLGEIFAMASALDDRIEAKVDYAYSQELGYLTACPTNVGTGLRASYMIHVPALEATGQLRIILEAVGKFGITFRGIYGESSEPIGSVFQVSNQVTLGFSEEEIIEKLHSVTMQIVNQELTVRESLLKERRLEFEDSIYRSYGVLSQARILTAKEAMTLLSDVKLGVELGLLQLEASDEFNIFDLMTQIQPANLQKLEKKNLDVVQRDIARANLVRMTLPKIQGG
ncbi:protein arginine kinase [Vallitaleaceae bacterium 9-2]